jgi:hypothetical protein
MKFRMALMVAAAFALAAASFAEDLPKPADLVKKYHATIGGKDAIAKVKTRIDKGKLVLPDMGMEAVYTAYTEPPNELNISDFSGMGVVKNGQSAGVAWSINPFQGNTKQATTEGAEIFSFADLDQFADGAKTLGEEDFNGKTAYKAEFSLPDGNPLTVFFDKESGFIVASENKNDDGSIGRVVFSDYKKVGDVQLPHTLRIEGAMTLEIISESIELNAEIPAGTFDLPEEIKALP